MVYRIGRAAFGYRGRSRSRVWVRIRPILSLPGVPKADKKSRFCGGSWEAGKRNDRYSACAAAGVLRAGP